MYRKKLLELGIPADINGFEFLNYAIKQYKPGQSMLDLYRDVGDVFGFKMQSIERNMRHAISKTCENITVGQFIAKYKILWEE